MMENLQKAIEHCYEVAKDQCGNRCANEHVQLAKWLEDLRDFYTLEEQGKLLILPCNYGDYVWFIKSNFSYVEEPIKARISYIAIRENGDFFFRTNVCGSGIDRTFSSSNIGKTVFLTEQEAKEALKGMKE